MNSEPSSVRQMIRLGDCNISDSHMFVSMKANMLQIIYGVILILVIFRNSNKFAKGKHTQLTNKINPSEGTNLIFYLQSSIPFLQSHPWLLI